MRHKLKKKKKLLFHFQDSEVLVTLHISSWIHLATRFKSTITLHYHNPSELNPVHAYILIRTSIYGVIDDIPECIRSMMMDWCGGGCRKWDAWEMAKAIPLPMGLCRKKGKHNSTIKKVEKTKKKPFTIYLNWCREQLCWLKTVCHSGHMLIQHKGDWSFIWSIWIMVWRK